MLNPEFSQPAPQLSQLPDHDQILSSFDAVLSDGPGRTYSYKEAVQIIGPVQEQQLIREWATTRLADALVDGASDGVVSVLTELSADRPEIGFGITINLIGRLHKLRDNQAGITVLQDFLGQLFDHDEKREPAERIFTDHDRRWSDGTDLDDLDLEMARLCIDPLLRSKTGQSKPGNAQDIVTVYARTPYGTDALDEFDRAFDTPKADERYDQILTDIAKEIVVAGTYRALTELLMAYKARTPIGRRYVDLLHDQAVIKETQRLLQDETEEAKLQVSRFLGATRPRTKFGETFFAQLDFRMKNMPNDEPPSVQ